jgi:hypothetical protein
MGKYTNIDETTKIIDDILRALARTLLFYVDLIEDTFETIFRWLCVHVLCIDDRGPQSNECVCVCFVFVYLCWL